MVGATVVVVEAVDVEIVELDEGETTDGNELVSRKSETVLWIQSRRMMCLTWRFRLARTGSDPIETNEAKGQRQKNTCGKHVDDNVRQQNRSMRPSNERR